MKLIITKPIIKNVRKYMPKFVKQLLTCMYQRYNSRIIWDKKLMKDLMEFFDLNYDEVICMLKLGRKIVVTFWNVLNPKTEEDILKFYEVVPYDAFSLAYWHMSRSQIKFREEVVKVCSGDVLDYGGGIGDLCVKLAERGLNVTYSDVKSANMEFAKWLFKKRGLSIRVIDLAKDYNFLEKYDTVVCIDVVEHTLHPRVVLRRIAEYLKDGGKLILTGLSCIGPTKQTPMHFRMDFDAGKLLNSLGLFKADRDWLWIKKRSS